MSAELRSPNHAAVNLRHREKREELLMAEFPIEPSKTAMLSSIR